MPCSNPKRWILHDETTPSGKLLYRCLDCRRLSTTPDKVCNRIGDMDSGKALKLRQLGEMLAERRAGG